ncbi:unnamed protein product [Microthlaspi erraticum]|uniref:DUF3444 domain-containing protein n=1 Tax=Microthlaspi erraticum TaxID=1685480 RepID=A0A6D2LCA0_9BRAS|nr:unnamed protein product [Microthlaspi erraticum]
MMDITSNELLSIKGTSSDARTAVFYASAENVHSPGLSCAVSVGDKRKRNEYAVHNGREGSNDSGDAERRNESVQPKISESSGVKFNNFEKLWDEVKFTVCQIWALYDTTDGVPRQYALVRKVSAPSFGIRITYLEPDPDDEKEIQWFEQDLPVSAGKFRLGKSLNTEDRSMFSHVMDWDQGSSTGHLIVSPREGETWAIFKNWDMNWSSEPDAHRNYEYDIVEILSGNTDGAGVSVAILHKAKGFASVFFRMGTGDADTLQIPSHSLYRFSHRVPSIRLTGTEGKGVPKDAYELDQAALPGTAEEKTVPPHLFAEPKQEALCFPCEGRVFQTGQICSFSAYSDNIPYYYRIDKITLVQAFEEKPELRFNVSRLKAKPFAEGVIQWKDKHMHVGCGTFLVTKDKGRSVFTQDDVINQIVPQTSVDGDEYTILPKIGELWVTYRSWTPYLDGEDLEENRVDFDIVEVLDDALDYYKVLALKHAVLYNEDGKEKAFFSAAECRAYDYCISEDGSEVIFTIPKSKMLRFSHQIHASRVTKEVEGEMKELFEVDLGALPYLSE